MHVSVTDIGFFSQINVKLSLLNVYLSLLLTCTTFLSICNSSTFLWETVQYFNTHMCHKLIKSENYFSMSDSYLFFYIWSLSAPVLQVFYALHKTLLQTMVTSQFCGIKCHHEPS